MKAVRLFFDTRPWYYRFAFYLVAFGGLTFLIQDTGLGWAVFAGFLFATFMTLFDGWRLRRRGPDAAQ